MMDKARKRLIERIGRLIKEMKALAKYEGLVSEDEYDEITERTVTVLTTMRIYGDPVTAEFLEWVEATYNDLAARRALHEDILYFGQELYRVLATHPVSKEERDRYMETLSKCSDRHDGRRMLRQIAAELAGKTKHEVVPPTTTQVMECSDGPREEVDLRVQNLENRASQVTSEAARALYATGLTASIRHEKIRLFKAAIRGDSRGEESGEATSDTNHMFEEVKLDHEVRYHNLHDLVTKRLDIVVSPVFNGNTLMCGEIIRALARFGNPGGFFKMSYLALNSLKKLVRRQYKTRLHRRPFDPTEFMSVVSALLRLKVIMEPKEKEHDMMISLSPHVHEAATPEAGRIIATVLALKRETSNGATDNNAG